MEKYNFTPLEEEMFMLLNSLKKQDDDKNVVFAVALMCMDSEETQQKVVEFIKANKDNTSLDDVCSFLNTFFEPLETSDDEDDVDEVPA
ncbi:MAG: hypothetical protein IK093_03510 [Ruminiclostridium sp.]|nr:hypothetical protein [Ruminiclostridium sp.]